MDLVQWKYARDGEAASPDGLSFEFVGF